ncbi:MAG: GDP-mannose 4,6-dehydratase [Chlamydiae bacterium]|nr:GDP-mannose 4,6-dehydratase [Chlamydiota bacterium]
MTKVLITGASGYIGKYVTLHLLNQGYEVRASVRNLKKSDEVRDAVRNHLLDSSNLETRLTFIELDLEKDSGVKRVILTSSVAAIYGCDLPNGANAYDETMWTDVEHPVGRVAYTKSKTLAE